MRTISRVIALSLVAGLGACAHDGPAYSEAPAGVAVVDMTSGLKYVPATVTIKSGQTVQWRNKAFMSHTVTDDPAAVKDAAHVALPAGAAAFDSGDIKPGAVWSHAFTTPGTYRYVCKPHEGMGMMATVVVTAG